MKVHALKMELVTTALSIARVDLIAIILRARVVGVQGIIGQLMIARKINLKSFYFKFPVLRKFLFVSVLFVMTFLSFASTF